jgi:hypothetical protein
MKRISTFIALVNAALFAIILAAVSTTATLRATAIIEDDARALLVERLGAWSMQIDGSFKERLAYIHSFKDYIRSTLGLATLGDDRKLLAYFKQLETASTAVLKSEGLLNLYVWFAPEYATGKVEEFSARNMKLDGSSIDYVTDSHYRRTDMAGGDWA